MLNGPYLKGYTRNMKDNAVKCDLLNCGDLSQEVSEKKNFSMIVLEIML